MDPGFRRDDVMLPVDMSYNESRALAHLVINPADVLADDPERQDLDADKREENRKQRKKAFGFGPHDEPANKEEDAESHSGDGRDQAKGSDGLNRKKGE